MPVGVKVTLRGNQMREFLYRMIAISSISRPLGHSPNSTDAVIIHSELLIVSIFPEIKVERQRVNTGPCLYYNYRKY